MDEDFTSVRDCLAAVPGISRARSELVDIFLLRGFLSSNDCAHLMSMIDQDTRPSPLLSDAPDSSVRTSETCILDRTDTTVLRMEARISALLGVDAATGEFAQGQRYETGQEFKPHYDYFREDQQYWQRQRVVGGQRTWTVMIYLNVPENGGETYFPKLDLTIPPREGSLIAWNNLDAAGAPNSATLHQGKLVTGGRKYIITKWYRQRRWGLPVDHD